jgi:hypothetical protein
MLISAFFKSASDSFPGDLMPGAPTTPQISPLAEFLFPMGETPA